MMAEGDIVLFRFPQTDSATGKLRPALLLKRVARGFDDWLVCMISTQLHQAIRSLDVVITPSDPDFLQTGLKRESLIRLSRLAVVDKDLFVGRVGCVGPSRLATMKQRLATWIADADT